MMHWHSTLALNEAAQKWRALAERRRAHFVELYHTKRWKRYYDEEQFLLKLREAIKASDRWAEIAPTPLRLTAIYDRDTARPQSSAAA
jgi:uncharacterized repeat protein (TIGR03809 family)